MEVSIPISESEVLGGPYSGCVLFKFIEVCVFLIGE